MEDKAVRLIGKRKMARLVLLVITGMFVMGCAGTKDIKEDSFFDKWNLAAKKSVGTSPVARVRSLEIPDEPGIAGEMKAEEKALPTVKVTLLMRDADINVVLRTLARAAYQNIIINSEVTGKVSVDFKRVPWDEAFLSIMHSRMLTYVWDGDIIRITTVEDLKNDLELEKVQREKREQQILRDRLSPLLTMVVPVDYADPEKLKELLGGFLTKNDKGEPYGSVMINKHTNSLVIQATRSDLERIIPMVGKIDKPTPQIRIEANIVETTKETARELGIQWGGSYGGMAGAYPYTAGGGSSGAGTDTGDFVVDFPVPNAATSAYSAGGLSALGLTFGTVGGNILQMQLSALESEGKINILSSPSITTLDNQMAFTENGERVPYVSYEDGEQEVKWEDAVLRLEITPHVIDDKRLKMKILVKKDEVDESRDVQGNPYIIKKQTDTTLIVNNGETIVISGLSKQRDTGGDSGVPLLKDIPGLGYLFKGESKAKKLEKVLIFITPHVLDPDVVGEKEEPNGAEKEPSADESNKTDLPEAKTVIPKESKEAAGDFVIQVASFKEKANADKMLTKLSGMGYTPILTETTGSSSQEWFVVLLKGYTTYSDATAVSALLERDIRDLECIVRKSAG